MRVGRWNVNSIDAILAVLLPVTAIGLFVEFGDHVTPQDVIVAARNGDINSVYDRVDSEFDFMARDSNGRTLLHAAVEISDAGLVMYILHNGGAGSIDAFDKFGLTPVHLSLGIPTYLFRGSRPTLGLFLSKGVDPNLKTRFGEPLLVYAIEGGQEQSALLLLEAGADANVGFVYGEPLLSFVVLKSMTELLQALLDKGVQVDTSASGIAPLAYAIQNRDVGTVRLLLGHGADPNAQWEAEWTEIATRPQGSFGLWSTLPVTTFRGQRMYPHWRPAEHLVSLRPLDLALWYDHECALVLIEHGAKSTWFARVFFDALRR